LLKVLVPLAAGLVWLVVSTVLVGFLPSHLPPPDVVLIMVIIFGFHYPLSLGGGLSFLLGLLQDVLSGGVVGLNALSKTVVFALTKSIAQRFYFPNWAYKIAMVFLGGIVDGLLVTFILLIAGGSHIPGTVLTRQLLLQVILTGLISPLLLTTTPHLTELSELRDEDIFSHGKKLARTRKT
jgi:rod shape-determining protein MreD